MIRSAVPATRLAAGPPPTGARTRAAPLGCEAVQPAGRADRGPQRHHVGGGGPAGALRVASAGREGAGDGLLHDRDRITPRTDRVRDGLRLPVVRPVADPLVMRTAPETGRGTLDAEMAPGGASPSARLRALGRLRVLGSRRLAAERAVIDGRHRGAARTAVATEIGAEPLAGTGGGSPARDAEATPCGLAEAGAPGSLAMGPGAWGSAALRSTAPRRIEAVAR